MEVFWVYESYFGVILARFNEIHIFPIYFNDFIKVWGEFWIDLGLILRVILGFKIDQQSSSKFDPEQGLPRNPELRAPRGAHASFGELLFIALMFFNPPGSGRLGRVWLTESDLVRLELHLVSSTLFRNPLVDRALGLRGFRSEGGGTKWLQNEPQMCHF